jgi:HK97 family phage major capsid protein
MAGNALFKIHNPWGWVQGNSADMRKYADVLDTVRDTILTAYRDKTGLDDASLVELMDAETWMDAEEAHGYGFVDEVGVAIDMAACVRFDIGALKNFGKVPEQLTEVLAASEEPAATPEPAIVAPAPVVPNQAPAAKLLEVVMSEQVTAPAGAKDAAEITSMCIINRVPAEQAKAWVEQGLTADQVGRKILDLHASGALSTPAAEAPAIVDLGKDAKNYSYQKAIVAAIAMREGKAASGFEVEIHQEISKKLPQSYSAKGGILIPMRLGNKVGFVPQNTVLTTGGTNTGAEVVFQEYGELIDMLRNISVVTRLGARTLTDLRGPISFPKQTGAHTLYWVGENPGSGVSQSNVSFGTVAMTPKTAQATGALSRQLMVQSTPDVEQMVREDLAAVHALGWDAAALHGTGQNSQPTGLYVADDVNAVAMGGVPTFGKLVDMETAINLDNALMGNVGFATTPGMAGKMRQTLESSVAGARWVWDGSVLDGNMIGYRAISSNQVSAALGAGSEHGIILGNWADLLIGMWAGMEIVVDPYTLADQGLIKITSFQMVDVAPRRGQSFTKATGATLA